MDTKTKKHLVQNSFWNLLYTLISRFGSLIVTIILTRFLLPERYGLYAIVFSIAMIFYTFADLGINRALVRYVSHSFSKNEKKARAYHSYLYNIKLKLTTTIAILIIVSAYPLSFFVFKNSRLFIPLLASSVFVFFSAFEEFYTNLFYSFEKVNYIAAKEAGKQIARILLLFVVVYVIETHTISVLFLTLGGISFFFLFLNVLVAKKYKPDFFIPSGEAIDKRKVTFFIGYLTVASISTLFLLYTDALILGLFVAPEFVAYYKSAFSLIAGIFVLVSFPNALLLPLFSKLDKRNISKAVNGSFRYLTILGMPAIFGTILLGNYFIRVLFGHAYLPATLSLYILSPLIFFNVATGIFLSLFSAEEKPEYFAKAIIVTAILNVVLNVIFISWLLRISPLIATAGAGIATVISWIFYFIVSLHYVQKELHCRIDVSVILRPLFASILMFVILSFILRYIDEMNLLFGGLIIISGMVLYVMSMLIIGGLEKRDFKLIMKVWTNR